MYNVLCCWIRFGRVKTRPTGFCKLTGAQIITADVYTDADILKKTRASQPNVVAIDAPLSLPPGRESIDNRRGEHLSESVRELLRKGITLFPITLGPMRKLTLRGIELRRILEFEGFKVIEVYPGGSQDLLGISHKHQGLEKLRAGLQALGINGFSANASNHELDAVTCAYVGKLFLENKSICYGPGNNAIIMPKGEKKHRFTTSAF